MPPDVHRLLEREAQRVNSTILMNRRAYADLISNLLSGKSRERAGRDAVISDCPFDNNCTSNNQTLRSAGDNDQSSKRFCSNVRCALRKFHVTDGQNTRDQITRERRSKRAWSNYVLRIPFILRGSPSECWLRACDACVITAWRLGCGLLLSPAMKHLFCLLKVPLLVTTNWNERRLYGIWSNYGVNIEFCLHTFSLSFNEQ